MIPLPPPRTRPWLAASAFTIAAVAVAFLLVTIHDRRSQRHWPIAEAEATNFTFTDDVRFFGLVQSRIITVEYRYMARGLRIGGTTTARGRTRIFGQIDTARLTRWGPIPLEKTELMARFGKGPLASSPTFPVRYNPRTLFEHELVNRQIEGRVLGSVIVIVLFGSAGALLTRAGTLASE